MVDAAPFEGFTPIMLPHRLVGFSIADLTRDIQIVKTTLWRQMLDGLYLSTSAVTDIATGALDPAIGLDDFLVRRPGGIRRARDIGDIRESTQQWGGAQAFPMLEYLDAQAEGRTGVSKRSAGLSPDLLNPNVSATASLQMMSAVQARQRVAQFGPPAAAAVVLAPILGPLAAAGTVAAAMGGPFGLNVPNEAALDWLARQGGSKEERHEDLWGDWADSALFGLINWGVSKVK